MPFGTCEECGWIGIVQLHHKIPLSKGGTDTKENLISLCPNCHSDYHMGCLYQIEMFGESGAEWRDARSRDGFYICEQAHLRCLDLPVRKSRRLQCFIVYVAMKSKTLTSSGLAGATLKDIGELIGLSQGTISSAIKILTRYDLIRPISVLEARRSGMIQAEKANHQ